MSGLSFVNEDDARTWSCNAAVHVEASDAFTLENCTFESLDVRALRITRSVQSHFTNVRVLKCGGRGRPAIHLDGTYDNDTDQIVVQGSAFTGFRVEGCFEAPYFQIDATGDRGENAANKFDDLGFEGFEAGNDPPDYDLTLRTFLRVDGPRNQFGKVHFWRTGDRSVVPKRHVVGDRCEFGELLFSGVTGPGGSVEIAGSDNAFGSIVVQSANNNDTSILTPEVRISGHDNRIGHLHLGPHPSRPVGGPPPIRTIEVTGYRNQLGNVDVYEQQGLLLEGRENVVASLVSRDAPATALVVRGSHCAVLRARITGCRVQNGPVVWIDNPAGIATGRFTEAWINGSRVCVEVDEAPFATEGILVTASHVELLPGSRVRNVPHGFGLRWCGSRGGWNGLVVEDVGKDGIFVDGGTPVSMHAWTARQCGTESRPGKPQWGGFRASAPGFEPMPASCTGFRIHRGGSAHRYSFKIESAGTGGGDHEHWQIRGNVRGGGSVVIPTGVQHSVDLDSDGQGDDVASDASKSIAMPDTANFVTVTGSYDLDSIVASWKGRRVTLRFAAALTVKDNAMGGNLLLNGDYTTAVNDTLALICDGTYWYEVARSAT